MAETRDPVLSDVTAARQLSGRSGARIYLATRDGSRWFVRKAASQPEGSARLRRQMQKQRTFAESVQGLLDTPQIQGEGEQDGRYYFDMDLVRGEDGATFLRRASYPEVAQFADVVCLYLERARDLGPLSPVEAPDLFTVLYDKLVAVQRKTRGISDRALARLFLALDGLRAMPELRPSLCHGDLTLENMVISPEGRVTVLDLLDAPYEHIWHDVAKLHQDLAGGWYLRHQAPVAASVLDYMSERICATAATVHPRYPEAHAVLLAITFARILPYLTDAAEIEFVQQRIEHYANEAG